VSGTLAEAAPFWQWPAPLLTGTLQRRYKRFLADVTLADGTTVTAHSANTGSMKGCSDPGSLVLLSESDNPTRKLRYTWEAVQCAGTWVGIHTGRANGIVEAAIRAGAIPQLADHGAIRREVKYGERSRVDLLLEPAQGTPIYVEVKNTTLAEHGTGRFPDSVTERGTRHMRELAGMVAQGARAAVVFLVHRGDCHRFAPADQIDPAYGEALRAAASDGVMVLPLGVTVTPHGVAARGVLPVDL